MKLTKAMIGRIGLPHGKSDAIFFDEDDPGFGLRIRAGGKKTWIVQYRIGAKQRRVTLGTVNALDPEKARKVARDRLAQVTLGGDPQAEKLAARAKAKVTLGAVVDAYLAAKKDDLRPKTFDETERYLRKHWRLLHGLPIHKIERRDVASRLREIIAENGPIAAARARANLSTLFAWAVGEGYADQNVVIGTHRPDQETTSRDRVLSDAEIVDVWNACRDDDYGRIVRLLILTGQRREEAGAMAWSELDHQRGTWSIPGTRTKNGRPHMITLPRLAWSIIETVGRRKDVDCLFGRGGTGFGGWSKSKASLDQRMLEAREQAARKTRRSELKPTTPWVVHDLRRTVATRMADVGVLPHVIETVLNHVSGHRGGVAGIYNRSSYEREVRAALALWSDHIRSLVEHSQPTVVTLRNKRA
jgi:integrase